MKRVEHTKYLRTRMAIGYSKKEVCGALISRILPRRNLEDARKT